MLTVSPEKLRISPQARVLDLGCGEGRHIHNLHNRFDIHSYALDLNFSSAQKTRSGFDLFFDNQSIGRQEAHYPKSKAGHFKCTNWLVASGKCEELPFADHSFDLIICSEVLEHVPNYHQALLEMTRTLKPQGQLVITVPRYLPEKICWDLSRDYYHEPGGHIRIFKAKPLQMEIERLGFKMTAKHFAHGLHAPYWWLKCLYWDKRETWLPIRLYHRLLIWDIMHSPKLTRYLENFLNPFIGKSVVLYFDKVEEA